MSTHTYTTILRDPIHGSMELDSVLMKIIDTPQFQRLRRIKQLGGASFVYPGAVHTRFEHSIGVCYIAGELVNGLNAHHDATPELPHPLISPEDKLCVQIAALCHDLGHGPFSHLYDYLELTSSADDSTADEKCAADEYLDKHEYRSAKILEELLGSDEDKFWKSKPQLPGAIRPLNKIQDLNFIKSMITFSEDHKKREESLTKTLEELDQVMKRPKKIFLLEIVANGITGIDVDKMDYFARDSHGLGLSNTFDWRRYIQVTKVLKVKSDKSEEYFRLCTRSKEVVNLYELFHTRAVLHQCAYQHKTTRIVEYMIKKALTLASDCVSVNGKSILKCWTKPGAFHLLDDTIVDIIMKMEPSEEPSEPSTTIVPGITVTNYPKLEEAKEWLRRVMDHRQLPKFLPQKQQQPEQDRASLLAAGYKDEWLIEVPILISYGNKKKNPLLEHYFYDKNQEDKPRRLSVDEVSALFVPNAYEVRETFWYYDTWKRDQEKEKQKAAETAPGAATNTTM